MLGKVWDSTVPIVYSLKVLSLCIVQIGSKASFSIFIVQACGVRDARGIVECNYAQQSHLMDLVRCVHTSRS